MCLPRRPAMLPRRGLLASCLLLLASCLLLLAQYLGHVQRLPTLGGHLLLAQAWPLALQQPACWRFVGRCASTGPLALQAGARPALGPGCRRRWLAARRASVRRRYTAVVVPCSCRHSAACAALGPRRASGAAAPRVRALLHLEPWTLANREQEKKRERTK